MKIFFNSIFYIVLSVLFCSCIENDIPYPALVSEITAFEVRGQVSSNINPTNRTVNVELSDSVDISKVGLLRMEVSNNAVITPEITSTINLSTPFIYTLTTYQNYIWTINATQRIDRYFKVENQIGDAIFDVDSKMILVTVSATESLTKIKVLDAKLGPTGADVMPNPLKVTDFTSAIKFSVVYKGKAEVWSVLMVKSSVNIVTGEANAFAKYALLSGQFQAGSGSTPTFEYKKEGDSQWQKVASSDITISGGNYSAKVLSLTPATTYIYKAVNGDVSGTEKTFKTEEAKQIVNSNFDDWTKEGKSWFPDKNLTPEYYWWDTGNKGANSLAEKNPTTPEEIIVVKGKAAKMASTAVMGVFAAGSIYVGEYIKTVGVGAQLSFGRKFTSRPKGLKGYYNYTSGTIDKTKEPYTNLMGKADTCFIYAILTDWTAPFEVNTTTQTFIDMKNDPGIIALCQLSDGKNTNGYKEFNMDFTYRNLTRKPTYIIMVASASKYGDYFSGSTKSVLYTDEFELVY